MKNSPIDKKIEEIECSHFHGGDECCWEGYGGKLKENVKKEIKSLISSIIFEVLPEKATYKRFFKPTESTTVITLKGMSPLYLMRGYKPGYNSCRQDFLTNLSKMGIKIKC